MSNSIQQPLVTNPEKIVAGNNVSHSNGSFTQVFIVLAIIAVISVASCIVGKFCSRRYLRPRRRKDHVSYNLENGTHMAKAEARVEQPIQGAANSNNNAIIVAVLDAKTDSKTSNTPKYEVPGSIAGY